jgi:hypothetical protein
MENTPTYPVLMGKYGSTSDMHQLLMLYIWGPGANVLVILALYTYRKWWTWVHGVLFALASITSLVVTIPMLMTTGMIYPDSTFQTSHSHLTLYRHYTIGITCMALMVVVSGIGFVNRILYMSDVSPRTMKIVRWGHRLAGYALLALAKANIYIMIKPDKLSFMISTDSVLLFLLLVRRLYFPKMGAWRVAPSYSQTIRKVRSLKELDQRSSYVMFANYIYDAQPLRSNHPGGYQVIQALRNR